MTSSRPQPGPPNPFTGQGTRQPRGIQRKTMASEVTDILHEMIIFGEIAPGTPLRLEEVAAWLNVSISPVREAMRQLESAGLVEHVAYKGARVTSLSADEIHDVYEARLAIETLVVRRAASRYDERAEKIIQEALNELRSAYAANDYRMSVHGNTRFHLALAEASGSKPLQFLLRPALEASTRFGAAAIAFGDREAAEQIEQADHTAIAAACRAGDGALAETLMRKHLTGFAELLGSSLSSAFYVSE
jgi:DNA-binding GntR family transcriptional regulator